MVLFCSKIYKFYFITVFFVILCNIGYSNPTDGDCNTETKNEFSFNYSTLLSSYKLNEDQFYGLPYFGYIRDWETTTFQMLADHVYPIKNVTEIKCGDIIFIRTYYIADFIKNVHPKILNPYIIITHNSDNSVGYPQELEFLNDPKILGWFGRNVIGRHPKLHMIPIGLLPYNYSIIHEASQNVKPFRERNLTLYLNFSPNTNSDRPVIRDYIKQEFWGDSDILIADKWTSWNIYLSHLSNAKFILSPPGVGLDCYRMWEAIIMRAIPIVLRNEISHLYDGLPVMFVDSWTDIKRKNLEKFEQKYLQTFVNGCPPNRPKIWARYWISKVMNFTDSSKKEFCK